MRALWLVLLVVLVPAPHRGSSLAYPAPTNVSIASFNMEHSLHFLPGPGTPAETRFGVEVTRMRRKSSWKPVAWCSGLGVGRTCNLTALMKEPWGHYQARVQAFSPAGRSDWASSNIFQPLTNTVLGPPDVSVSGCGNCLILQVRPPATGGQQAYKQLRERYQRLACSVRRSRDGAQFHMTVDYQEQIVIGYLEPGVEYCVTVSLATYVSEKSAPSEGQCALTSPPPTNSSVIVLVLLTVFCLLAVLLTGSVLYGSQLTSRLFDQDGGTRSSSHRP